MTQIGYARSVWRQGTALIVAIAVILLSLHGSIPVAEAHESHATATPMAGMPMPQEFDLMFIDMMIAHHEGAIAMAELALTEGEHQEVRDLAHAIVVSQQDEIDQLRTWRDAWYPGAHAMPMDELAEQMGMMMPMPAMMATPATGMMNMPGMMGQMVNPDAAIEMMQHAHGPFDQALLEAMIPHHQGAMAMAQVALQQAVHPELKALAQEMTDAQQREIAQMQAWLAEWYGGTPVAATDATQVDVTLTEFAIHASLTTFEVGQRYAFTVTNAGAIPHEFMIMPSMEGMGQMDMETLDAMAMLMIHEDDLPPGASQTVEVVFTEPATAGEMVFVCAVPGHLDAGMTLAITVN